jgi:hypothetical protein
MDIGSIFRTVGVTAGNTIGAFINFTCPKCGAKSKICEYGGNVVDGTSYCPKCHRCING